MPHIINDDEYRVYQEFKKTGLTPAQVRGLLAEHLAERDEYIPQPMIDNSEPTPEDFWDEK